MKTKSFLFAVLVTVSFATTSCQKEESIMPATDYSSMELQNIETRKVIIDGDEMLDGVQTEKPQRFPKTQATQDSVEVNIAKIDTDNIK